MLKKILFPLLVSSIFCLSNDNQLKAQSFNEAKVHLANHKLDQAIPILEKLWANDQSNANLNYLLGLCYVKEDRKLEKAVTLLETAASIYSSDYDTKENKERRAPEYVYYYLTIAYSKTNRCEKALGALNKFYQVYTYNDEYYLVDGQKWVRECNRDQLKDSMAIASEDNVASAPSEITTAEEAREAIVQEVIQEKTNPQMKERLMPFSDWENLRTKEVNFTSLNSQYGIQIAALIELRRTREFSNVKNVEVYVDENGIFRYVIGRFPYRQQAEALLAKIREQGYSDAFIVDINQPDYTQEVLGYGEENIDWHLDGKVDFRVQVGAFTTIVTSSVAEKYLEIDGIKENAQNGLTILTVGSYPKYEEAAAYRDQLIAEGIHDAFVVAFNRGNKVSLKEAKEFVQQNDSNKESEDSDKKQNRSNY